ncbi:nuclear transport factor 2 family protein [Pseudomonas sp. 5P_3.1_Bac2]|uniref:nuclear transport factor 2 family protein n=1 Tax=Pseudomonas sp. 5P_3.1_Bac2 TaxID=2971617 RepID=UPI0021CAA13C|nr:nuclear transport factor 2 family protein [Pseudomonas sp. 5P_3.1_Bac2]MCU1717678.1 nuclear transport factor 2 family protein [Pseudomonas sp. 5P_3.1_Bac2]
MSKEAQMKSALQAYIDAFNRADLHAIVALYAADATVEDPYGSPPKVGQQAIREFYRDALLSGAQLELAAPIRASMSNAAAMAFVAVIGNGASVTRVSVIDLMTFNEQGLITSMQAYFGQSDIAIG